MSTTEAESSNSSGPTVVNRKTSSSMESNRDVEYNNDGGVPSVSSYEDKQHYHHQHQMSHPYLNVGRNSVQQTTYGNHVGAHPSSHHHHTARNASPVLRPSSAASNASTASYLTANTANISMHAPHPGNYHIHNSMAAAPMARYGSNTPTGIAGGAFMGHPGQQQQQHNHLHSHPQPGAASGLSHAQHPAHQGPGLVRPTGRYPMPPRSSRGGGTGGMHPMRSVPFRSAGGGMGNSPSYGPPHHQGVPQQHQYQQQHPTNYGPMSSQYEYQYPSNYQHHQGHAGYLSASGTQQYPSDTTTPAPMMSEKSNELSDETEGRNQGSSESQDENDQEKPLSTVPNDRKSSNASNDDHLVQEMQEVSEDANTQVVPRKNEEEIPTDQDDAQHYHQQHQYHSGYPRDQHYHQPYQPPQLPFHHQHHPSFAQNHHAGPFSARYGNYPSQGMSAGGISPPPPGQPPVQYYPSDYQLGASAAHHGHYAIHPQDQQYFQDSHGFAPPQHHHQGNFQLPSYTARRGSYNPSPDNTADAPPALSRSPSPPPMPPASSPQKKPALLDKAGKPLPPSDSSESSKTALVERGQNMSGDGGAANSLSAKPSGNKKEDATADAASILLQLCAKVVKVGDAENENPHSNSDDGGQQKPAIPQNVLGATSMDEASEMTHPDLTSEPSQDSIEQMQNRVLDSEFPCEIPSKYPTRLCLPYDGAKLNSLHCFLRSDLLEIFVVQKSNHKSPTHSPHSSIGRVGLRCVHCAMNRRCREDRDEAPMAVFYPKSVAEIYRLVTSWQRCHLRKCRNLPPAVRTKWLELRETDKSRGKTHYWVTAAKEIGLRDCQGRAGGIRFSPDLDGNKLPPQTKPIPYIPVSNDQEVTRKPPGPPMHGDDERKLPLLTTKHEMQVDENSAQNAAPLGQSIDNVDKCSAPLDQATSSMEVDAVQQHVSLSGEKRKSPRSRLKLPTHAPADLSTTQGEIIVQKSLLAVPPVSEPEGVTPPSEGNTAR